MCLVRLIYGFEHDRRIKNSKKIQKNISYIESYSPDLIIIKLNISLHFKSLLLLPRLSKHVQDLEQAFTYQRKKNLKKILIRSQVIAEIPCTANIVSIDLLETHASERGPGDHRA